MPLPILLQEEARLTEQRAHFLPLARHDSLIAARLATTHRNLETVAEMRRMLAGLEDSCRQLARELAEPVAGH
jgi:hypothetical protein